MFKVYSLIKEYFGASGYGLKPEAVLVRRASGSLKGVHMVKAATILRGLL